MRCADTDHLVMAVLFGVLCSAVALSRFSALTDRASAPAPDISLVLRVRPRSATSGVLLDNAVWCGCVLTCCSVRALAME